MPVYKGGRVIAWSAMFGHMTDVGGKVAGLAPDDARTIYEEGFGAAGKDRKGRRAARTICSRSSCTTAVSDVELLGFQLHRRRHAHGGHPLRRDRERFGDDVFYSAMDAMLERNKRAMRELIPHGSRAEHTSTTTSATTA